MVVIDKIKMLNKKYKSIMMIDKDKEKDKDKENWMIFFKLIFFNFVFLINLLYWY